MRRAGIGVALAAVILVVLASGAKADAPPSAPLSTVIDRYFAWRGGEAYAHLKSLHETGYVESPGRHLAFEHWEDRDGHFRQEEDFGKFKKISGETGGDSWVTNPSGQVLPGAGGSKAAHRLAMIAYGDALRSLGGAAVSLQPGTMIGGQPIAVVRVSFGDPGAYDVFINPITGALVGYRITDHGVQSVVNMTDWRVVDGVRVPFAETIQSSNGQRSSIEFTTVIVNPAIGPSFFERPKPPSLATFRAGATSSGWIPFELYGRRVILFPAKVNGHAVTAVLDSGATSSVLDSAFAASIGLAGADAQNIEGLHGNVQAGFIPKVSVDAGDLTLKNLMTASLDLAPMSKVAERPLLFFLGDEVFNELVVDIDFAGRRLRFLNPTSLQKPLNATQVPLLRTSDAMATVVRIEGGALVPVDFDLGASIALEVYSVYSGPAKLLQGRQTSASLSSAVGGERADTVASLRQVDFGGVKFSNIPAIFPNRGTADESAVIAGRIGVGLLSRFRLMVDFPESRLYVVPNADATTRPFDKDRLGLSLERDGAAFKVMFVSPDSPAAAAGFKTGERVVAINGKAASAWSLEQRLAVEQGAAGTQAEFKLDNGATRPLTLADYY